MKFTTRILALIFVLMIAGLLSSNMILKKQYDAMDKSDIYWTYDKVLEQPFKYLNINGGNETNIYYEPSPKPSVRLLQEWIKYHHGEIKASVRNDTLYLNFDYKAASPFEKVWLRNSAPVRIFSPELLSGNATVVIEVVDTIAIDPAIKNIARIVFAFNKNEVESSSICFFYKIYIVDNFEAFFFII